MDTPQEKNAKKPLPITTEIEHLWEQGWTYIKTVVDIVREPVLILDKNFRIIAANEPFCEMFRTTIQDTEGRIVYELGNGQWNIPVLRKLLEDILPKDTFFKSFQVTHEFPKIGHRVMILNARQIHFTHSVPKRFSSPIILLAMEDVTEMMVVAEKLANHTKQFEAAFAERVEKLEEHIKKLEREIQGLKKSPPL